MNRVLPRLGLTALALVSGSALYAQSSSTTGSVTGIVRDANGAPLSGVTITLSSGQVTRTTVTGADGSFRLGLLNPGSWTVKADKSGFQQQSSSVTVATNDNRAMNFKLATVSSATVEVVGSVAVVDTTSSTIGQTFSMDQISSIPKARDFSGVALFSPGVVDGGFQKNSPSMSGASAAENSYYVDGLDTTDYRRGFQGAQLATDFIDQVSVQTAGFAPEFSALGGVFNAITKSGSNDVKGSAWLTWDAAGIHSRLKQNNYYRESTLDVDSRYDVGGEVGGPIIKDKLFFFAGVDAISSKGQNTSPVFPSSLVSDAPKDNTIQTVFKFNWYLTPDMQLTWFGNYNDRQLKQGTQYPLYGNAKIGFDQKDTTISTNLSYDWTITPTLALSLKAGFFQLESKQTPQDTTDSQYTDYAAGYPQAFTTGGFGTYTPDEKNKTVQYNAALSWFVGSHNLKIGAGYLSTAYTLVQITSGDGNVYQIDSPTQLEQIQFSGNATVKAYYQSFFAQDNWEVTPGLRLIYGVRYEGQKQDDARGVEFISFGKANQVLQPRLGVVWDINNDGKTKLSGSFARYNERIPQRAAIRTWAPEIYLDHVYTAGNWTYNAPPANGNPGPGYQAAVVTGAAAFTNDYSTPFSYDPIAKGIRPPLRTEVSVAFDHTFDSGWTFGISYTYRKLKDPIEDSVIHDASGNPYSADDHAIWWNPGPGAVTWTQTFVSPDAGTTYTAPSTSFPEATNLYRAATITVDKRSNRDYFSFNYTYSKLTGNYEGVVTSSNGQSDGNITASFDQAAYVGTGYLPLDRTHVAKIQYSHRFTLGGNDLNAGLNYSYQTGTPKSLFDNGAYAAGVPEGTLPSPNNPYDPGGYGNSTPANGQYGQFGRTPTTQQMDTHLDYAIKMGAKLSLIPEVDIFNLFNARKANTIDQFATLQFSGTLNPSWQQESSWQEGRRFRFGVRLRF